MRSSFDIIWDVVDEIATQKGWSASMLARTAGLDATAFNLSKRMADGGKPHYPSMTTMLAVLSVTGLTWFDFAKLWQQFETKKRK